MQYCPFQTKTCMPIIPTNHISLLWVVAFEAYISFNIPFRESLKNFHTSMRRLWSYFEFIGTAVVPSFSKLDGTIDFTPPHWDKKFPCTCTQPASLILFKVRVLWPRIVVLLSALSLQFTVTWLNCRLQGRVLKTTMQSCVVVMLLIQKQTSKSNENQLSSFCFSSVVIGFIGFSHSSCYNTRREEVIK